jgi:hypothetical protein
MASSHGRRNEFFEGKQHMGVVKAKKDHKPIGCQWVFQTKKITQGQVVHDMAKFMAKGYAQKIQ